MHDYSHLQKRTAASATVQAKSSQGNKSTYLQDNRPQSAQQRQVFQLRSVPNNTPVTQLAKTTTGRTLSGHGKLRREKNKIKKFKVPKGKTIMRPAPPGATLGNLSMLLNEQKGLTGVQLRNLMKISTTKDLWRNKKVIKMIKNNVNISKTKTQEDAIDELIKPKGSYDNLTPGQKGSLTKLESNKEFETWAHNHVQGETFKEFTGGQMMEDMQLEKFEDKLKSKTPHSENEYVSSKVNLSKYVKDNKGVDNFMVNACSWDENCDYTGFQIDKK